jgi:hypothetical protein
MPQTTPLFDENDLGNWLRQPVTAEASTIVERVVWGWLCPLLKVVDRPDDPSAQLLAWAIELGGIAFANPEGLSSYQLDSESSVYGSERREEILRAVVSGGEAPDGVSPAPLGSFPPACPDPFSPCC